MYRLWMKSLPRRQQSEIRLDVVHGTCVESVFCSFPVHKRTARTAVGCIQLSIWHRLPGARGLAAVALWTNGGVGGRAVTDFKWVNGQVTSGCVSKRILNDRQLELVLEGVASDRPVRIAPEAFRRNIVQSVTYSISKRDRTLSRSSDTGHGSLGVYPDSRETTRTCSSRRVILLN